MPMKDSQMTDDWLARVIAANPITVLPSGYIRTCPVRLAFPALFQPFKSKNGDEPGKKPSYGAALLFPPGVEQQIQAVFYAKWFADCQRTFPKSFGADGQPFGLHWPFHPQAEKQNQAGYTPGLYYLDSSSQFKPPVVDTANNPIVDESRVYPGVWAFVALNAYTYDNKKRGVGFGIQSVMLIADDTKLYTAGGDPTKDFAGVTVDAGFNPSAAFGATPAGAPPGFGPPASVMPAAQPVYHAPAPGYAPPPVPVAQPPVFQPPARADDYI